MTHTLRYTLASGCNFGVVQESRNRLCRYATDVAKYTLLLSLPTRFHEISIGNRPQRVAFSEGVHPTGVAQSFNAPYRGRTMNFAESLARQG